MKLSTIMTKEWEEDKFEKSLEFRITETIVKETIGFLFNFKTEEFLALDHNICTWKIFTQIEVEMWIREFILQRPYLTCRESTKNRFFKNVADHLKRAAGRRVKAVPGIMLLNCFFTLETGKIEERSP